jgi:hypothetical protein
MAFTGDSAGGAFAPVERLDCAFAYPVAQLAVIRPATAPAANTHEINNNEDGPRMSDLSFRR